ncbi:MAG: hypothetical protein ACTSVY_01365 [Candidatus Helarchaeota archaeon]
MNETEAFHKLELYFKTKNVSKLIEILQEACNSEKEIDFSKIKDLRFKLSSCVKIALEAGVMSSDFSNFFKILNLANLLRLFRIQEKSPPKVKSSKIFPNCSHLFLENLRALFQNIDQDFIDYIMDDVPLLALDLINNRVTEFTGTKIRIEDLKQYVENVFYAYTLRTRKIANFEEYILMFRLNKKKHDDELVELEINSVFQEVFSFDPTQHIEFEEVHVLDEELFETVVELHQREKVIYDYPIISLVTSGGVGPQGKGFAYLTPLDEVVEVCSDLEQNKAYILKFKEFLKSIFLTHLKKRLIDEMYPTSTVNGLIDFLKNNLQLEYINIEHYELIINNIKDYFETHGVELHDKEKFMDFLKTSLFSILTFVKLEDQFKLRMKLIREKKLRLSDVSKLVSLGDVTHHDILNQRQFFIHLLDRLSRMQEE